MKAIKGLLGRLPRDERETQVVEYALIAGLVLVAAIAILTTIGGRVLARWSMMYGGG
jgi:Flp pilus assembly pilin Flp